MCCTIQKIILRTKGFHITFGKTRGFQSIKKLFAAILLMILTTCAGAQSTLSSTDAIILIAPQGDYNMVAVTFHSVQDHRMVENRMRTLATQAGWKIYDLQIKDTNVPLRTNIKPVRLTDAVMLIGPTQIYQNGAFKLQPLLFAFADFNRFEVMFMVTLDPGFNGLYAYDTSVLKVTLTQPGGPYRYLFEVKDHKASIPVLPVTQPRANLKAGVNTHLWISQFAPVVIVAASFGLLILFIFYIRALKRNRQTNR